MEKDRLPVGTIIKIRFSDMLYMILGYETTYEGEEKDYCVVEYPLGYTGEQSLTFISKDFIKEVRYEGLKNKLFEDFNKKMNEM